MATLAEPAAAVAEHEAAGRAWGREEVLAATRHLAGTAPDQLIVPEDPGEVLRATGLTRREVEVALLLENRRTDQEIADTLFVSVRTVTTHVSAVLRKLGVASRRDVRGAIDRAARRGAPPSRRGRDRHAGVDHRRGRRGLPL